MGLDTTHGAWRGAYSSFSAWRNAIAQAAGFTLKEYRSPYSNSVLKYPNIDSFDLPPTAAMGDWPEPPFDPLLVLFAHSSCDGVIHPEHCKLLADRLEGLLHRLDDDNKALTVRFIDGLRLASSREELLEFE